jgi:hypothetical protein
MSAWQGARPPGHPQADECDREGRTIRTRSSANSALDARRPALQTFAAKCSALWAWICSAPDVSVSAKQRLGHPRCGGERTI